jgi:hypothetical protein
MAVSAPIRARRFVRFCRRGTPPRAGAWMVPCRRMAACCTHQRSARRCESAKSRNSSPAKKLPRTYGTTRASPLVHRWAAGAWRILEAAQTVAFMGGSPCEHRGLRAAHQFGDVSCCQSLLGEQHDACSFNLPRGQRLGGKSSPQFGSITIRQNDRLHLARHGSYYCMEPPSITRNLGDAPTRSTCETMLALRPARGEDAIKRRSLSHGPTRKSSTNQADVLLAA